MVSVSVRYLFYQPMDEKIKHGLFVFPLKKTLIWKSEESKRTIHCFLKSSSGMNFFQPSVRLTNQKPRPFVSVRQTNQIAVFPFVCCFSFVCAFSFQGHTKIALLLFLLMFGSKALYTSKTSSSVYAEVIKIPFIEIPFIYSETRSIFPRKNKN